MNTIRGDKMAKSNKKSKQVKQKNTKSNILYIVATVVILIPLLMLGYIYFSTKENKGKPTVGNRFDNALVEKIEQNQIDQVKSSLKYDKAENVEINLTSATLRITIDLQDTCGKIDVDSVLNDAYKKTTQILPVETYFTNKDDVKMYDLDIHVYNFIPKDDDSTDGWVYKEKIKNASSKKAVTDTLSSARSKEDANALLKQQKELEKEAGQSK